MKIASWNVNGIRAVAKKGFFDWLKKEDPDIICLQETKAFHHQLEPVLQAPPGYTAIWHDGEKKGYAGTVIFTKQKPLNKRSFFDDITHFHEEGRIVELETSEFFLLNGYFPNGNPRSNGEERLTFKLEFYDYLMQYVQELRQKGKPVVIVGDFNIAHTEIDIARPKENKNSIGFLEVEREKLSKLLSKNFYDGFRKLNPEKTDAYTWWTYRSGARERNVGWRIDYVFIDHALWQHVQRVEHQTGVLGSDHCPLILEMNL